MITIPAMLITTSSIIILLLGSIHLLYTFKGRKMHPCDRAMEFQMKSVSPVLTTETTMWKAWIGFNASHSLGAILFGLIFTNLAMYHIDFLFQSWFLLSTGFFLLTGYVFLAKAYWFSIPFRGIILSLLFYIGGIVSYWL